MGEPVRRLLAQAACDLEAVDVGQHHIQDDQVGVPLAHRGQRLGAGLRRHHMKTRQLQSCRQQFTQCRLVLHEQQALRCRHGIRSDR
jgi:hypothetical protein